LRKNLKKPESLSPNAPSSDGAEGSGAAGAALDTSALAGPSPLENVQGDFALKPDVGPEEETERPKRGRPRGSGAATTRSHKRKPAQPETPVEVPPDPALVASCKMGVHALTGMAEKHLEFSDPGDEWRETMGELTARLFNNLQSDWIKSHPVEAACLLHLSMWVVPNAFMYAGRAITQRKDAKQENAKRNHGSLRQEADEENTLDLTRAKTA
jgi:hypothetical protein